MIKTENLSKSYFRKKEEIKALQNINIEVNKAELFGLIGPDGAGKTTLIRILATLLLPTHGWAKLEGFDTVNDYAQIRKIVGYMPGNFSLYPDLTVEENLKFFATIFQTNLKDHFDLYKEIYTQLEPFKNRLAGKLSGGMKQKLALCCALIHKPEILILDEPTTGVDAVSRVEFWQMLNRLKEQNITIFVSTPYMDEASQCDRIALIQEGKILEVNTPAAINAKYPKPLLKIKDKDNLKLLVEIPSIEHTQDIYAFGEFAHVVIDDFKNVEDWKQLARAQFPQMQIEECEPNIEDSFIYLLRQQKDD